MIRGIIRVIIALSAAAAGASLGLFVTETWVDGSAGLKWAIWGLTGIFTGLIGFSLAPKLISATIQTAKWYESKLNRTPTQDIFGGVIGLIVGLIIANLLGIPISRLPFVGPYLFIAVSLLIGYLGWNVGAKKKEEFFGLLAVLRPGSKDKQGKGELPKASYKILDTSVIIDGRIADICKSGFVEGTLIIPNFVLEELRHIADSSDLLKRNRGRRGLDILNIIRKDLDVMVKIYEKDFDDIPEVDSKLVKLAQVIGGQVITNDYNLNKVAELQGVKVLNINELSNAVKPVVLPGEEMIVQVIKDGKELGQGVAYLDDGTMIVVENGKRYIGQIIGVMVTSVLQTAAGRMIFAKPKTYEKKFNDQPALEVNAGV
ncbi:PIN/TRAM domain-containing protein [Bacillota bacterium LX-D]|nr:PIN/TRAM domain-containing protein [Bacillota bacterium LX-D]